MLTDKQIKESGGGLISPFDESKVQAIGYDLTSELFYRADDKEIKSVDLEPMESVFVRCKETISLPDDMTATIILRNSRIRQGLLLTAPIYHPGHTTPVFFRVTNVSSSCISLHEGCELATVTFDRLPGKVDTPYNGTFQQEKQYVGMGSYKGVYLSAMSKASQRIEELKSTEKNIYTNVLALLAIFVAIFSVINVNVSIVKGSAPSLLTLVVWNFCTLGAVGFLVSMTRSPNFSKCGMLASAALLAAALLIVCVC